VISIIFLGMRRLEGGKTALFEFEQTTRADRVSEWFGREI